METASFDTASQPLMQRGGYWLDEVCARHIGVHGQTHVYNDPFFYGRMQRTAGDGFATSVLECSGGIAHRRPDHLRRWTHDSAVVFVQRGRGAVWRQRGRDIDMACGDVMVANPDEPYELTTRGDFNIASFYVPRTLLSGHFFPGDIDTPRLLPHAQAEGGLVSCFAAGLAERIAGLPDESATAIVDTLARLVAVAAGAAAPPHGAALRQARLEQALNFISRGLADPALSPASCAQALGMSVRALHLAFEPSGESFSQAVARLRLERCRALLTDSAAAARPVSDIAYSCGFGSLAGFYRAFGRAYGMAPTDMRAG